MNDEQLQGVWKTMTGKRRTGTRGMIMALCLIITTTGSTSLRSQGLFESAISGDQGITDSQSFTLGGYIRSVAYAGRSVDEESLYLQSVYAQAGLLVNASAGKWATAKTDLRLRYGNEFTESVTELELREAYVDLTAGPAGFRIGKMISPWGKATVFNPVDVISPLNPTVRSPEEDDMYKGFWAVQGRVSLGSSVKLTGTWKPLYEPSVLLIDQVPMPDYVYFTGKEYPGLELKESSYGIKLEMYTPLLDGSIYWFDGYQHWPGIRFESFVLDTANLAPGALNLLESAYKIRMLGMDLSVPLGSWILRAEGAWQHSTGNYSEDEYVPYPEFSYTAEIERSGTHFITLAGYYGKYISDFEPAGAEPSMEAGPEQFMELVQQGFAFSEESIARMITGRIGAFNRLYNYQLEEICHSVFMVIKLDLFHSQLEVNLPAVYNISTEELIIQPGISWLPADGFRVSAGFSGFYGREDSLYDLVGPVLNAGYLSFRLTY
jgi:hypothetical protein